MKNTPSTKLYNVYRNSTTIIETSLNDFKRHTRRQDHSTHKANRRILDNAGINYCHETLFSFADVMYYGFRSKRAAQSFFDTLPPAKKKLQTNAGAVRKVTERWKIDMKNETYSFL